jgi:DNA invertase Pin-like site-specific DNA recombinase
MATEKYIAYYRVSTDRQGKSGLGLEAQQKAVSDYLNGGNLVGDYTEVESGKRNQRPALAEALEACKRQKAKLVIAKLDRLTRNARFLLGIVESSVDVVFCELPEIPTGAMGKFILTQMAAIAELEGGLISERTKAALQAAKARGTKLGWSIPARKKEQASASRKGVQAHTASADNFARNVLPIIHDIEATGNVGTLKGIADALNARGIKTAREGKWYAATVKNVLARETRLSEKAA